MLEERDFTTVLRTSSTLLSVLRLRPMGGQGLDLATQARRAGLLPTAVCFFDMKGSRSNPALELGIHDDAATRPAGQLTNQPRLDACLVLNT
jgi:hypothetical protein